MAPPCGDCGSLVWESDGCAVEVTESGGGNPAYLMGIHLACLLAEDNYGVVPSSVVEWVGVE